jgi:hypothetical protein
MPFEEIKWRIPVEPKNLILVEMLFNLHFEGTENMCHKGDPVMERNRRKISASLLMKFLHSTLGCEMLSNLSIKLRRLRRYNSN